MVAFYCSYAYNWTCEVEGFYQIDRRKFHRKSVRRTKCFFVSRWVAATTAKKLKQWEQQAERFFLTAFKGCKASVFFDVTRMNEGHAQIHTLINASKGGHLGVTLGDYSGDVRYLPYNVWCVRFVSNLISVWRGQVGSRDLSADD